ncbi:aspartate/glutamate racemase family protein [Terribacillus aidingensis]|uniref:aspartate/glutamate racemase family protein n=1 Tax=Terribacillus aidingensis TaxID=586416 RepID=UPI00344CC55E
MKKKIGLIHATMNSVQPILSAFQQHAPEAVLVNFMDESLIYELNEKKVITNDMVRRLVELISKAERSGVDGILLTCSSFTPCVEQISDLFDKPLLSADMSMLERAVEIGSKIGVIATVEAAGPTTEGLLKQVAQEKAKEVDIETVVIHKAFQALQDGRKEDHDYLILEKIKELESKSDVIVLAQFSMARVLEQDSTFQVPVLTSPEISVKAILQEIQKHGSTRLKEQRNA